MQQTLLLGWPHDSLIKINANATRLAELLGQKFGESGSNVAFVCHSRGGLVARAAAMQLFGFNSRWNNRIRGCVTFGTPHEGAELAEIGDQLLGKLLLLQTISSGGRVVPLIDALWVIFQRRRLDGITDLMPRGYGGNFLEKLTKKESKQARQAGSRLLPILAIGGKARPDGTTGWLAKNLLGGVPNDFVVPFSSSAPPSFSRSVEASCNHFRYFSDQEQDRLDTAIEFLSERLLLDRRQDGMASELSQVEPAAPAPRHRAGKLGEGVRPGE